MAALESQTTNLSILRASIAHVPDIAALHKANIAGANLGRFQDIYLKYYYEEILSSPNIVMVAVMNGKVVGFCSLVSNQSTELIQLARKHLLDFLRLSPRDWVSVFPFIYHKIAHEILGGKWGKGQINPYRDAVELRAIAVHPDYRKAAVGSHLLRECVGLARREHLLPIISWVAESNDASNRLFIKNGFRIAGTRKDKDGCVSLFLLEA